MKKEQAVKFLADLNGLLGLPEGTLSEEMLSNRVVVDIDGIAVRFGTNHDCYRSAFGSWISDYRYEANLCRMGEYDYKDHSSKRIAHFRGADAKKAAERVLAMVEYGKACRERSAEKKGRDLQINAYNKSYVANLAAGWGVEPASSYAAHDLLAFGMTVTLTRSLDDPMAECQFSVPADAVGEEKLRRIAAILAE